MVVVPAWSAIMPLCIARARWRGIATIDFAFPSAGRAELSATPPVEREIVTAGKRDGILSFRLSTTGGLS